MAWNLATCVQRARLASTRMAGIPDSLKGRSYTRVSDWSRDELELALDLADELKQERAAPQGAARAARAARSG